MFAYAKTKAQISFAVTAKLISAFVFATRIVQSFFFLNLKFQASSLFLRLYRLVCVGPSRKPRRPVFSRHRSFEMKVYPLRRMNLCESTLILGASDVILKCYYSLFDAIPLCKQNSRRWDAAFFGVTSGVILFCIGHK